MVQNKGLIFKSVPEGLPVKGKDLVIEDRPIDLNAQLPKDGVLLRNFYLSFDPYQRGRMRPANTKSYAQAFTLGEPIVNDGIAKVVKSANPAFKEGDVVLGHLRTEEYSVIPGDKIGPVKLSKLENPRNLDPKLFLGALGMPGLTAYASFYEIGEPKKGETIFISAASGAVGQIVGQLAKHEGLKVIGSVGDDAKAKFITEELNFDSVFNYKKEKPLDALKRLAPDGIDIYFENVGGETLDAVLEQINNYGRIIACGMISQYNSKPEDRYGVKNLIKVFEKRLKMQGFIVLDPQFGQKWSPEHQKNLQQWLDDGSFTAKLSVTEGIDNAIDGLLSLFSGKNFGKAILQIADLQE